MLDTVIPEVLLNIVSFLYTIDIFHLSRVNYALYSILGSRDFWIRHSKGILTYDTCLLQKSSRKSLIGSLQMTEKRLSEARIKSLAKRGYLIPLKVHMKRSTLVQSSLAYGGHISLLSHMEESGYRMYPISIIGGFARAGNVSLLRAYIPEIIQRPVAKEYSIEDWTVIIYQALLNQAVNYFRENVFLEFIKCLHGDERYTSAIHRCICKLYSIEHLKSQEKKNKKRQILENMLQAIRSNVNEAFFRKTQFYCAVQTHDMNFIRQFRDGLEQNDYDDITVDVFSEGANYVKTMMQFSPQDVIDDCFLNMIVQILEEFPGPDEDAINQLSEFELYYDYVPDYYPYISAGAIRQCYKMCRDADKIALTESLREELHVRK